MSKLTIGSDGFSLPLDAVTTTIGILGIRGSGKTHTASVVAEEMLAANLQVVVLDPLDCWWGLRTSADGKGPGYAVTVLGGEHADIPLEASSGPVVADFAVAHGVPLVLSLRHFSKTDQRRFVAEFCERLYRLKGRSENKSPLHVIIDEADEVAPQRLAHGSERCFGAVDTLVRRGRSSGIGVTLISQRPAAVNKDVLTQIELLTAHRVISPQDRKAIGLWIEAHPVGDRIDKMLESIAALSKGECWVWSPSWLDVFKCIQIRQRRTFDSSATPKIGSHVVAPTGRTELDLSALRSAMAETIERAERDDPAKLRKRILELERQKAPVADHSECRERERSLEIRNGHLIEAVRSYESVLDTIRGATPAENFSIREEAPLPARAKPELRRVIVTFSPKSENSNGLGKCPRALLSVLCAYYPNQRTASQVAIQAGYSSGSGSFANALGELRSAGYVQGGRESIRATDAGLAVNGSYEPMPTGRALVEWWASRLGKCERTLLLAIADSRRPLSKEELGHKTDYSETSGSFANALGKLRTLGLISRGSEITLGDEVLAR